jgi:colicin import membrane protein
VTARGRGNSAVVISADKNVKYESVVKVMDTCSAPASSAWACRCNWPTDGHAQDARAPPAMFAHDNQRRRLEFAPPPTPGLMRALVWPFVAHALLLAVLLRWGCSGNATHTGHGGSRTVVGPAGASGTPPPPPPVEPPPQTASRPSHRHLPHPAAAAGPRHCHRPGKGPPEKEKQGAGASWSRKRRQKDALKAEEAQGRKASREKEAPRKRTARQTGHPRQENASRNSKRQQTAKAAKPRAKKLEELRQQQIERMPCAWPVRPRNGQPGRAWHGQTVIRPVGQLRRAHRCAHQAQYHLHRVIAGNPAAEVEVRTSPDGTIISRKLVKSSGVKSWDDAVLNAIDKTEKLPPDTDGRVIPSLTLGFRPKD